MDNFPKWILSKIKKSKNEEKAEKDEKIEEKEQKIELLSDNTTIETTVKETFETVDEMGNEFIKVSECLEADIKNLEEIKDDSIISKLSMFIPQVVDLGINYGALSKLSGDIYKVSIPAGTQLAKSRTEGAFRGFVKIGGKVKAHADLKPLQLSNIKNLITLSSAMKITSFAVGMYYLNQINSKLEKLQQGVEDISDTLESDKKGKLKTNFDEINKISKNLDSIISNEDERKTTIIYLNSRLGVNSDICNSLQYYISEKLEDVKNYKDYIEKKKNINKCWDYLVLSNKIRLEMGNLLDYIKNKNEEDEKYSEYENELSNLNDRIEEWNQKNIEKFSIDFEKRIRKLGILDKVNVFKFKKRKNTTGSIAIEKLPEEEFNIIGYISNNQKKLLCADNDIIVMNGKYYIEKN